MTRVNPYLFLGRATEEALSFYAGVFRGTVRTLIRWREAMPQVSEADANRVIHAEFEAGGVFFMVSDPPGEAQHLSTSPQTGPIGLALAFDERAEQERVFAALSDGGEVHAPLHDTFYGGRMGVVRDRFGVQWLLNWSPSGR